MVMKSYRIGVIAPHLDGEYYGILLTHIQEFVLQKKAQLFAIQVADDYLGINFLEEPVAFQLVDAWILILPACSEQFLDMLLQSGKPVVLLGFRSEHPKACSVLVDNRIGMKEAVLHLIDHGHRDIAFIGHTSQYDLCERYHGYAEALHERGIPVDERLVIQAEDNVLNGGAVAASKLLESGVPFTAVAAGTDLNALGLAETLRMSGIKIPEDAALIGFDDIQAAATLNPPLTTVRQPFRELAGEACQIIFNRLERENWEMPRHAFVKVDLIVRQSCGCREASAASEADLRALRRIVSDLRSSVHQVSLNSFRVASGFLQATRNNGINISELFWNQYHWGCLALWEDGRSGGKRLAVRDSFSRRGDPVPPVGAVYALEEFPPLDYLPPTASFGGEDIVVLHPVKTETLDWGFLVLVGPYDKVNHF